VSAQPAPSRRDTSTTFAGGVLVWDPGSLPVGEWDTIQVRLHVDSIPPEGSLVLATIGSNAADIRPTNNVVLKIYNAAGPPVSVEKEGAGVPKEYALMQNFPNPFNPTTEIVFALPKTEKVTLAIYDVLGRKVRTLLDRQFQPGQYSVSWDGTDQWGRPVASGIYLYRLQTSDFTKVRKMAFIKR